MTGSNYHVWGRVDDCVRCVDCEALASTAKACPVTRHEHVQTEFELVTETVYGPWGWESITYYRPVRNGVSA